MEKIDELVIGDGNDFVRGEGRVSDVENLIFCRYHGFGTLITQYQFFAFQVVRFCAAKFRNQFKTTGVVFLIATYTNK